MRRREFIKAVAGLPGLFPLAVSAQQGVRHIGILFNCLENDPETVLRLAAFRQALGELGWTFGANLRVDVRYGTDNVDLKEKAKELVDLSPEIVVANAPPGVEALQSVNSTIPMVFAAVTDPVGLGIVQSLAHPGGNATGFLSAEFVSAQNGWSYSRKSHLAFEGLLSLPNRTTLLPPHSLRRFKQLRLQQAWS